jgi:hypothetical protein
LWAGWSVPGFGQKTSSLQYLDTSARNPASGIDFAFAPLLDPGGTCLTKDYRESTRQSTFRSQPTAIASSTRKPARTSDAGISALHPPLAALLLKTTLAAFLLSPLSDSQFTALFARSFFKT